MRIAFATSQVISRHATMKRAFGMAPTLLAEGHAVAVAMEEHPDNRAVAAGVPGLEVMTFPGGLRAGAEARAKTGLLAAWKPDVVHACGLGWRNFLPATGFAGAPVIPDHVELESSLPGTSPLRRLHVACLEWWGLARYRHHVAASVYLADLLRVRAARFGLRRKVHLFPYAADAVERPGAAAREAFRQARGLGRFALYAGGFYRNYGFWTMLEAAAAVAAEEPGFRLVLCGRGPEQEAGERWIAARGLGGVVRVQGYVPAEEFPSWLAAAEVLLSPLNDTVTDRARCPSKIPLYMAAGRPVVTCRVGEAPRYLGDLGHYYEPGSAQGLAAVLAGLWRRPPLADPPYDLDRVSWRRGTLGWLDFARAAVQDCPR